MCLFSLGYCFIMKYFVVFCKYWHFVLWLLVQTSNWDINTLYTVSIALLLLRYLFFLFHAYFLYFICITWFSWFYLRIFRILFVFILWFFYLFYVWFRMKYSRFYMWMRLENRYQSFTSILTSFHTFSNEILTINAPLFVNWIFVLISWPILTIDYFRLDKIAFNNNFCFLWFPISII